MTPGVLPLRGCMGETARAVMEGDELPRDGPKRLGAGALFASTDEENGEAGTAANDSGVIVCGVSGEVNGGDALTNELDPGD